MIAVYRTSGSGRVTGRVDGDVVDALPRSVRFICSLGEFDPCSSLRYVVRSSVDSGMTWKFWYQITYTSPACLLQTSIDISLS